MRVLVTGGAGYIGSHTLLQLLYAGHKVCVLDNYSNSSPEALRRVKWLAEIGFAIWEGDIRDSDLLNNLFDNFKPEAVIHFAGLKSVGESTNDPLKYYSQNVAGSIDLLKAMQSHDCWKIVFSSSATVYGEAQYLPLDENHPLQPTNPYGRTKLFIEELIRDWISINPNAGAIALRYFNPIGADVSGFLGEDSNDLPNNLMPYISQVAARKLDHVCVFGDDYNTRDGTGERDYVHVEDLARAHVEALNFSMGMTEYEVINVGTGRGTTVLELIDAFEHASKRRIPYKIVDRREGDVARSLADVSKAGRILGWKAERGILKMCESTWRWQSRNPTGYARTSRQMSTDQGLVEYTNKLSLK